MARRRSPRSPFRGESLRGGAALGEALHDPRIYHNEPRAQDLAPAAPFQPSSVPGTPRVAAELGRDGTPPDWQRLQDFIRTLPMIIDRAIMTPRLVGNARAVQLDMPIKNRIEILIANMSDNVIWWGFDSSVAANGGLPLAANTVAGNFTGASFTGNFTENVEFWAIAAAGAANLVVMIEAARA